MEIDYSKFDGDITEIGIGLTAAKVAFNNYTTDKFNPCESMSSKEVMEFLGVCMNTIRNYTKRGLLSPSSRNRLNHGVSYRYYRADVVKLKAMIDKKKKGIGN